MSFSHDDDEPPPPGIPPMLWVMLAFSMICVLAGITVARLGPTLFPKTPPHAAASPLGKPAPPR